MGRLFVEFAGQGDHGLLAICQVAQALVKPLGGVANFFYGVEPTGKVGVPQSDLRVEQLRHRVAP